MSVHIAQTPEVQDFLRLASGLDQPGGTPRTKQIVHRILSDLFKTIDDLDITSDEYWAGIAYLNQFQLAFVAQTTEQTCWLLDRTTDASHSARTLALEHGTSRGAGDCAFSHAGMRTADRITLKFNSSTGT